MTTKSLQARQARQTRGAAPQRRGAGALGMMAVAAVVAIVVPGVVGLGPQAPETVSGTRAPAESREPAATRERAVNAQDGAAAQPAAEPVPQQTSELDPEAVPMPPRSFTPWRPKAVVRVVLTEEAEEAGEDAVGPLVFPSSMSSRSTAGDWFGARPAVQAHVPSRLPASAARTAPPDGVPTLPMVSAAPPAPMLVQATEPGTPTTLSGQREPAATAVCPGGAGCADQPALAPERRDITAALFPGGEVRPWTPVQVQPASPEGRDITRRLFPSGAARW